MEKAAERSAKVGEVRRLVAEGATLDAALLKAGVSETTYRRWAAKFDAGGVAALSDAPKSGRPPVVKLDDEEKAIMAAAEFAKAKKTEKVKLKKAE